jgi:hypothetical protein
MDETRMDLRKFLNNVHDNEPRETHLLDCVILTRHWSNDQIKKMGSTCGTFGETGEMQRGLL